MNTVPMIGGQVCQMPLRPKAAPPALHAAPPSILLTLSGTVGSGSYLEIMLLARLESELSYKRHTEQA